MKKAVVLKSIFLSVLLVTVFAGFSAGGTRFMENLDRGVVAVSTGPGIYIGWRMFGTDPTDIAFNVYRNSAKLNASPITTSTNYLDTTGTTGNTYFIVPVIGGVEQAASEPVAVWDSFCHSINLASVSGSYSPNDASVGDLDGDGQYEIVIKRLSTDISQTSTTFHLIEAYRLDGTFLWRLNLGPNNLYAPEEINPMVYDFDSDGRAEVVLRTCEGNVDGIGVSIGDTDSDGKTDYRDSVATPGGGWYMTEGPEFLSIFDGLTGEEIARTDYIERDPLSQWGLPGMTTGQYAHRADKCMMTPAYLDGQRPSLVICRGIYHRIKMEAWNFRDGSLSNVWSFDTDNWPGYAGQGNHNLTVGDVDNDGKDEIVYASMCVDDNGSGLYTTGLGHGDALHMSDMIPDRPGLEVVAVHESGDNGTTLRDAGTGEILWQKTAIGDTGRGCAAHIDSRYPGYQMWSVASGGTYNATDKSLISANLPNWGNFLLWWDGDLQREILDDISGHNNPYLDKWYGDGAGRLLSIYNVPTQYGTSSNNGTKGNPCLSGDILGDWREEMIYRSSDNTQLRIFTTTDVTNYRFYTLMHDSQYRTAIAWQCNMYNQPPHPSFYIGAGMSDPPVPDIILVGGDPDETNPPIPDPMEWIFVPHVSGNGSIAMQAATAIDPSGVEYYFDCTSGGGHDSGWQDSTFYKDTGLTENVTYTYTVTARDKSNNQNTTLASIPVSCVVENMTGLVFWDFEDGIENTPLSSMSYGGSRDTISGIIMYGFDPTYGPSFSAEAPPDSGLSIYCSGSQDGYTLDASLNAWSPQTWTIEVSVKLNDISGWETFVGRDGSSNGDPESDFYLQKNNDSTSAVPGAFRVNYETVTGLRWKLDADFPVQANRWYRLAVTSDGAMIRMYCDKLDGNGYQLVGSLDISSQTPAQNALAQGGDNWTFARGWYSGAFVDHINGYLDNVRFTETALTPEEFLDVISPVFTSDPINNLGAVELSSYAGQSLANYASDLNGMNTVIFNKDAGPDWLTVASDGTLSGIPLDSNVGENAFTFRVTDTGGLSDTATMTIQVANIYSGVLGTDDLLGLAAQWLSLDCVDVPACNGADLDGDDDVSISDFSVLAHNWLGDEALQLHLKFDETSGDAAYDSSIYWRPGTLVNAPAWDLGYSGNALSFDGTNDYVEVSGYQGIPGGGSRTCMAWVKTASVSGEILTWGEEYNGGRWVIRVNEGGQLRAEVQGGNIIGTTVINNDTWHHVAVVIIDDGSPDIAEAQLYVDGQLETVSSFADEPINSGSAEDVKIGAYLAAGGPRYFQGLIDEVRIYDTALTEQEIQSLVQ